MANQWFRLYHEFATDPKIQMMPEAYQRRYIMILCLRCCNDDVTLHDEEVAFQLRISNEEWVETKAVFVSKNLIKNDNTPTAWDRRQYVSDSSAERVARHRAKKKEAAKKECNVTVTPPDTDTDTDTELKPLVESGASDAGQNGNVVTIKSSKPQSPPCPHQDIINLYNQNCTKLPKVVSWTPKRQKHLQARWRESPKHQSLEFWERFFSAVNRNPFLSGENDRGWTANIDWLVNQENFVKTIERLKAQAKAVNQ